MKDELKERLENPERYRIRFARSEKFVGKKGIYKGHLFFLIKEIKENFPGNAYASVSENRLMELLLNGLYGEGNVLFGTIPVGGGEREFFWIPE